MATLEAAVTNAYVQLLHYENLYFERGIDMRVPMFILRRALSDLMPPEGRFALLERVGLARRAACNHHGCGSCWEWTKKMYDLVP